MLGPPTKAELAATARADEELLDRVVEEQREFRSLCLAEALIPGITCGIPFASNRPAA